MYVTDHGSIRGFIEHDERRQQIAFKIDDFCHFNCILKVLSDLKMYASALCFFI